VHQKCFNGYAYTQGEKSVDADDLGWAGGHLFVLLFLFFFFDPPLKRQISSHCSLGMSCDSNILLLIHILVVVQLFVEDVIVHMSEEVLQQHLQGVKRLTLWADLNPRQLICTWNLSPFAGEIQIVSGISLSFDRGRRNTIAPITMPERNTVSKKISMKRIIRLN
jgi:hypothetical protein